MDKKRIILLCGNNVTSNIVYNHLNNKFGIDFVIRDKGTKKSVFLKKRIKRLGYIKVFGQILFSLFVSKPLAKKSQKRIAEIIKNNNLDTNSIPISKQRIGFSVNNDEIIKQIRDYNPDLIIVNGTKIISKKLIDSVNCKLINTHVGITPKYRGVHGMYWALVNKDLDNSGVTIHFIDEHIDTGSIIEQAQVLPTKEDNFTTYPYLQIAKGVQLLDKAVEDYLKGNIKIKHGPKESHLWTHPTIWQYIYYRLRNGVK